MELRWDGVRSLADAMSMLDFGDDALEIHESQYNEPGGSGVVRNRTYGYESVRSSMNLWFFRAKRPAAPRVPATCKSTVFKPEIQE